MEEIMPTLAEAEAMLLLEHWTPFYLNNRGWRLPDLFFMAWTETLFGPFCVAKSKDSVRGN